MQPQVPWVGQEGIEKFSYKVFRGVRNQTWDPMRWSGDVQSLGHCKLRAKLRYLPIKVGDICMVKEASAEFGPCHTPLPRPCMWSGSHPATTVDVTR